MGLFSWLRSRPSDGGDQRDDSLDARLGTGLWRQHRDRFGRAVDRLYATAVQAQKESPGVPAVTAVVELTHRLSELDQRAAQIAQQAHSSWPLEGLVLPADVRQQVGDLPELLSRAAGKVSEAAQAAAHVRVAARQAAETAAGPADAAAASAARFVDDAEALIAEAQTRTGVRGTGGRETP
ncbi:hypothetical protein [Brevibacterium sp. HMSC24B04]|uniref:hypothetical protein n=1 Tax=Brevibacterium sp. HMSC24B04 TaxID=1581060 RepID=UPI0008CF0573|nr:hypothetical protein [Brevibacterium sp. HMSC24B04]OFT93673.1 hypothetical protein HMPREF3092_04980 [Brevibacterium sp. HMSC24B04]